MLQDALPNLLLPLLIGTIFVLLAVVLLRADASSFGKHLLAGATSAPAALRAADRPTVALSEGSVLGAARAAGRAVADLDAQLLPPPSVAALRARTRHPELASFSAVLPGAMRLSVLSAIAGASGSGARSTSPVQRTLAPPGPGRTAR